jgi:hypothetical protein
MSVLLLIADAIQKADKSYLFEDYTQQALAVVQALKSEGYVVVPKKATDAMLEAGEKAIEPGKIHPKELVRGIYQGMIHCGERERPVLAKEAEEI